MMLAGYKSSTVNERSSLIEAEVDASRIFVNNDASWVYESSIVNERSSYRGRGRGIEDICR